MLKLRICTNDNMQYVLILQKQAISCLLKMSCPEKFRNDNGKISVLESPSSEICCEFGNEPIYGILRLYLDCP